MARLWLLSAILSISVWAQQSKPVPLPEEPPEEDESVKPAEYVLNPLQAQKELRIGNFYFKKGSWKAAAKRFEEAALWDPGYADAYLRLGETRERQKNKKAAAQAYAKYLELVPDSKRAGELRKKIDAAPKEDPKEQPKN